MIKKGQKINEEQEKKLIDKVFKMDEDENIQVYEIFKKHGVFDKHNETFTKRFLTF